LDHTHKQQRCF